MLLLFLSLKRPTGLPVHREVSTQQYVGTCTGDKWPIVPLPELLQDITP